MDLGGFAKGVGVIALTASLAGKSALVLFCYVLKCVQYGVLVTWLFIWPLSALFDCPCKRHALTYVAFASLSSS